jgi:hypothetical protein
MAGIPNGWPFMKAVRLGMNAALIAVDQESTQSASTMRGWWRIVVIANAAIDK